MNTKNTLKNGTGMDGSFFAETLLSIVIQAAGVKTPEEQARISWRMSDLLWQNIAVFGIMLPRRFNNCVQDKPYPWVNELWSEEEVEALRNKMAAVFEKAD